MRVYGYTRVSLEEQARNGISLDMQQAKIEAYALVKDWPLVRVICDDGYRSKNLNRPGAQELLALIEAGQADVVIIYKLDRITRSIEDLQALVKLFDRKQVSLVSLQESLDATTATGRLMMNLLASVSQWEREVIGERTRDAMQYLKAQGKRYCHAVFGDRPEEAATLMWMQSERQAGRSYAAIAARLNELGIATAVSGRWQGNTVRRILRRTMPRRERSVA
jgi:site-specific DNA recombinase